MISKTATQVIEAMVVLAENPDEFHGTSKLAERIGAPQNYLGKLLHRMIQSGLVHAQRGVGGGFRMARSPEAIKLIDIVESIDNVSEWEHCFLACASCSAENPCSVLGKWVGIRDAYISMLKETTLADLVTHQTAATKV